MRERRFQSCQDHGKAQSRFDFIEAVKQQCCAAASDVPPSELVLAPPSP